MSKKQRRTNRRKNADQNTSNPQWLVNPKIVNSAVDLAEMMACDSIEQLQAALTVMGFEVNKKRFSELPPLSELKRQAQLEGV